MYRQRLIAVIDDNAAIREMLQKELTKAGYRTFAIEKTEHALETFDEVYIDGLIVDLLLPEMNGLLLVQRLRARHNFLPVILTIRASDPDVTMEARAVGIHELLQKPIDPKRLLTVAASWFGPSSTLISTTPSIDG